MRELDIWIPGKPLPKERPRRGPHGGMYTPKQTVDEENRLAEWWRSQDLAPWETPIGVELTYTPEGVEGRIYEFAIVGKIKRVRGDLDNLIKLTLDGLQKGGAFDDRQVHSISATK